MDLLFFWLNNLCLDAFVIFHYFININMLFTPKKCMTSQSLQIPKEQNLYQIGTANQVLFEQFQEIKAYYLPCYVRLKIKSITGVCFVQKTAIINGSLIISVSTKGIKSEIKKYIAESLASKMKIQINREEQLRIQESNQIGINYDHTNSITQITIRKAMKAEIHGNFFVSPFERLFVSINYTLNSLTLKKNAQGQGGSGKRQNYRIYFNSMDILDFSPSIKENDIFEEIKRKIKISFEKNQSSSSYGEYCIASMQSQYWDSSNPHENYKTNLKKIKQKQLKKQSKNNDKTQIIKINKFEPFCYVNFQVVLYKKPFQALLTIFLPVMLLSVINLLAFFDGSSLKERGAVVATLLLGFIQLVPTIKQQLPQASKINLIELIIYSQSFCCFLSLFEIWSNDENKKQKFIWYTSYCFLISLTLNTAIFFVFFGFAIIYSQLLEPKHQISQKTQQKIQNLERLAQKNKKQFEIRSERNIKMIYQRFCHKNKNDVFYQIWGNQQCLENINAYNFYGGNIKPIQSLERYTIS